MIFFFQAEDGIRDGTVTGVQTCALPIYLLIRERAQGQNRGVRSADPWRGSNIRSEERRVGKECRFLWLTYLLKKIKIFMYVGVEEIVDNILYSYMNIFQMRSM